MIKMLSGPELKEQLFLHVFLRIMKLILSKLKLNEFSLNFKVATDFKLINILNGLQSASSTFPCAYGKCKKPQKDRTWQVGPDRTFANLIEHNKNWVFQTESDRNKLKNFFSV